MERGKSKGVREEEIRNERKGRIEEGRKVREKVGNEKRMAKAERGSD